MTHHAGASPHPTSTPDPVAEFAAAAVGDGAIELHAAAAAVDPAAWDALLAASPQPTPFLRHAFLAALEASGCVGGSGREATGWLPQWLLLKDAHGRLRAGCVLYLKAHSYGEYVFDWSWADAWQRAGGRYYPKLLGAVPFTPVPGSRLLARAPEDRRRLLAVIEQLMHGQRLSSAHLLFMAEADRASALEAGWLLRRTVQFHWQNRAPEPYADFDDFLASLQRDKRKKIAQERRYVREAGVTLRALHGTQIEPAHWDFFHRCYTRTYHAHRSSPYLNRDFFARVAAALPDHWLMVLAEREGRPVAASLIALDPERRVAYGRYWGATEAVRCLHFEACYYAPLAWCIDQGWARFEGGAQGEHKMARGLLPVDTWSAHRLADPGFHAAVARHLAHEAQGMAAYVDELREHSPFRPGVTTDPTAETAADPAD